MKASDLMIGDYILAKPSMMPIQVAAVHNKKIGYHAVTHKLNWVREGLLEPIPITPEILEKNGFESTENIFGLKTYKLNDDFILEDRGEKKCLCRNCYKMQPSPTFWVYDIEYVHELQNALRLCKISKTIEL